jgi:hypothetical protein
LFAKFEPKHKPTVEDLFTKTYDLGSIEIKVSFGRSRWREISLIEIGFDLPGLGAAQSGDCSRVFALD